MKNRIQKDVIFSVELNKLKNWDSEIVDDIFPVHRFIEDVKEKVFIALDMSNFDKYMATHPDQRIQFLKENWDINF
mgnify:CR=1 FL=1